MAISKHKSFLWFLKKYIYIQAFLFCRKMAAMLGYGYYFEAKKKSFNLNILFQEPKKGFMFADSHVVEAVTRLEKNNIVIVTVSNKLGRFGEEKSFRTFCADREHRFLSATGLGDVRPDHFDLFLEAMNVNYSRMKKHGLAIKKLWDKATEIRVKTEEIGRAHV